MRKKILMMLVATAVLAACGGKTSKKAGEADEETTEQIVEEEAAAVPLESKEALEAQVARCYAELNRMAAEDDVLDIGRLDKMFCSASLKTLMQQVADSNARAEDPELCFSDEGHHWLQGLGTPIEMQIDDVYYEGGQHGELYVTLKNDGHKGKVRLMMELEDGQWKIDDFGDYEFDTCGLRTDMNAFLGKPVP